MDRLKDAIAEAQQAWAKSAGESPSASDRAVRAQDVRDTLVVAELPIWPWCTFRHPRVIELTTKAPGILSFCARWTRSSGSAFLSGPTGIGKTLCMVALGKRIIGRLGADPPLEPDDAAWARRVRFMTADDVVRAGQQHPLGRGEAPVFERATSASLLLLDDLGNEAIDKDNVLFRLLDRRYLRSLPTILSTYLPESDLRSRYGDAFVRRIVDHGSFVLPGGAT